MGDSYTVLLFIFCHFLRFDWFRTSAQVAPLAVSKVISAQIANEKNAETNCAHVS
jgi:hypothetical protein